MSDDGGMTAGELQRRLADLASTTLRKDVYDADERRRAEARRADQAALHDLEDDMTELKHRVDKSDERRAMERRLWLGSLAFPILVGILLLILTALVHK